MITSGHAETELDKNKIYRLITIEISRHFTGFPWSSDALSINP